MTSKTQLVINHIQDNINWQIYKKGERIPAVRELAKTLNVSAYTVSQAYDKLVAQGIIYAKQGSGYYVSSPTQQVLAKVDVPVLNQNVLDTGWLLQHLFNDFPASHCSGSGLLSPEWLYPQNHIIRAHKKVSQHMNFVYGYGSLQGYLPLREQLSRQLADINILAHPDAMVTTSGVSSAIETIARAMCQSGDYVLVDDPTWFWIIGCLQQLGLNVIGVNRNSHGVDIAQLQQILESYRPKLYITNSVLHNPTSFNLPPNNIFEVLRLMAEYDCYIVEDDVYRYFIEDNNVMRYATLDGLQRVFYVTGVSKVLGGNWRVGLVCCPQAKLEAVLRQKMLTNMTCPELTERTICEIWQDNAYKKHLLTMQRRLREAHETLKKSLNEIGLVYPNHTMQGLFVWLNVGVDSKALALQAYKDGWIVAPSHLFSPTAKDNTHIRLNVTRTSPAFLKWLKSYLQTVNSQQAYK